ncbi:MAG: ABC transporter permease [Bacteroidales bacterium]|jgi:putative ABC transport system permease protein|nr:ABC transporter permease [Bacteroidales bacterium]
MLKNYFITAFRNLTKNKIFSTINILGLSIGISACLLISLYVNYERSYDKHIDRIDQLYRVLYERETETGEMVQFASASPNVGPTITEKIPEILKFARAYKVEGVLSNENISFREEKMLWAEPGFLDLFAYEIIRQSTDSLLGEPNTMLISEETAHKYFGKEDPLGKLLKRDGEETFRVVGIFKSKPENTHYDADILLSFINWENHLGEHFKRYGWVLSGFYTYVLVEKGADPTRINRKIENLINQELGEFMKLTKMRIGYQLQPVKDIHLTSHYMHELKANGNKNSVLFLYIIAWFIIIIAWINFVNLLTISSIKRSPEISLRKVLGGTSPQLIRQFLFESLLINSIALLLAFLFIELSFPLFSGLTNIPLSYTIWDKSWFMRSILLIFLIGTLLAGSYPVWGILSRRIIATLRQGFTGSKRAVLLRKSLVVFQFFMAIVLIAGTLSVYQQLQYLKSKETGINKSDILVINTPRVGEEDILAQRKAFKEEIKKYPFVKDISFSSVIPGKHNMFNRGGVRRISDDPTSGKNYRVTEADHQFMEVYSNIFLTGRNFTEDYNADAATVIVNLAASNLLGFEKPEDALQEKILVGGREYTIIGIIENFHQESPRLDFEPQIFRLPLRFDGYFSIKLDHSKNLTQKRKTIEQKYQAFFPGNPFDYFYLEDFYNKQYRTEEQFGKVFGIFSLLALFITLLGILSLSAFSAAQRRKEIGIRKVMGASVKQILVLLSKSYVLLLILSCILAVPVIYYALNKWLNNFANRMELTLWIFIIPMVVISGFSLIMVALQSIKTAKDNPVNSLRYE